MNTADMVALRGELESAQGLGFSLNLSQEEELASKTGAQEEELVEERGRMSYLVMHEGLNVNHTWLSRGVVWQGMKAPARRMA